jgi:hypothetical protein
MHTFPPIQLNLPDIQKEVSNPSPLDYNKDTYQLMQTKNKTLKTILKQ